jgi:hypothetical protein
MSALPLARAYPSFDVWIPTERLCHRGYSNGSADAMLMTSLTWQMRLGCSVAPFSFTFDKPPCDFSGGLTTQVNCRRAAVPALWDVSFQETCRQNPSCSNLRQTLSRKDFAQKFSCINFVDSGSSP